MISTFSSIVKRDTSIAYRGVAKAASMASSGVEKVRSAAAATLEERTRGGPGSELPRLRCRFVGVKAGSGSGGQRSGSGSTSVSAACGNRLTSGARIESYGCLPVRLRDA